MTTTLSVILVAAWAAIGIVLAYGLAVAWRRVMLDETPLPFFSVLEGRHLSVKQVEESAGFDGLVAAVRRCAMCSEKTACSRSLAGRGARTTTPGCPNAGFFQANGL
jgi:hypothetical protein